jgi:hypothetical protein
MPNQPNKSCAACARRGRPCVTTSWASLDRSRDDLSSKIDQDERAREVLLEQLNNLQMRLMRNRKLKEKKESEASEKLACLEEEMRLEGEEIGRVTQDPLTTEEGLAAWNVGSPFTWFDASTGVLVPNMPVTEEDAALASNFSSWVGPVVSAGGPGDIGGGGPGRPS